MNGATPAERGFTPLFMPRNSSSVRAGSVPPPFDGSSGLVDDGGFAGAVSVGACAGVVAVWVGAAGADVVVAVVAVVAAGSLEDSLSPPPQPARATAAATASALDRMRITRIQDDDLRRGHLGLERLGIGLDRRERVVVARDDLLGPDQL